MRLLLLNNNPAVSRLIRLSVEKVGYHLDEYNDYALVPLQKFDLILVDNDSYHENEFKSLCEQSECGYSIYIGQRGHAKPEFTNVLLEKPFLPTDFLGLLEKVKNVLSSFRVEPKNEMIDLGEEASLEEELKAFDIDSLESLPSDLESLGFDEEDEDIFEENEKSLTLDDLPEELDLLEKSSNEVTFGTEEFENDEVSLPSFELETEEEEKMTFAPLVEVPSFEEEVSASILDKDDINEVKLLLDESDEPLAFDEEESVLDEEETIEEEPLLAFEESVLPVSEEEESMTLNVEKAEEVAIAFDEPPFALEEEMAVAEEPMVLEESATPLTPVIATALEETNDVPSSKEMVFDSLDALNENAIKRAFGEEVEEEIILPVKATTEEVDTLRNEIEQSITQSLAQLTDNGRLKEALKNMRINVAVTFEEV